MRRCENKENKHVKDSIYLNLRSSPFQFQFQDKLTLKSESIQWGFKLAMSVVDDAKEKELALPAPEEPKRIEPPNKKLPKPDDEIPF